MSTEGRPASPRYAIQPGQSPTGRQENLELDLSLDAGNYGWNRLPQGAVLGRTSQNSAGAMFRERAPESHTGISQTRPQTPQRSDHDVSTSVMSSENRQPRNRRGMLRQKRARLEALRDDVRLRELELEWEQGDLNIRLSDVEEAQQDLMNAFREEFDIATGNRDIASLDDIWQRVRSANATYNARLARIRQLEALLVDPRQQLYEAEKNFTQVVDETPVDADEDPPVEDPAITSHNATRVASEGYSQPAESDMSISELLQYRRMDKKMYEERLNELEWEQSEDMIAREFLLDRGDKPDLQEEEFLQSYLNARERIFLDLAEVEADIVRLEGIYNARASGVRDDDGSHMITGSTIPTTHSPPSTRPTSYELTSTSPFPIDPAAPSWSHGSTAGSTKNSVDKQQNRLETWFEGLKGLVRPKSAVPNMEHDTLPETLLDPVDGATRRSTRSLD